jgi:aminopeptidase
MSLPHDLEGVRTWREERPAVIAVTGNPHPRLMEGRRPETACRICAARSRARNHVHARHGSCVLDRRRRSQSGLGESIFGIPDVDRLWRAIAVATRLDERDPVDAWRAHLARPAEGSGAAINFDKGDALVAMALTVTGRRPATWQVAALATAAAGRT